MARPGVKEGKIRKRSGGIRKLRKAIGRSFYEGISVEGHCMGIQARTWRIPPQAANFDFASDGAAAVIKAGKMRHTKPPRGSLAWYYTGTAKKPGHVLTVCGIFRNKGIGNVGSTIQVKKLSYFKYQYLGWCYPGDVPGWV